MVAFRPIATSPMPIAPAFFPTSFVNEETNRHATEIYKNSNYNIALVQQLLQHSSAAVTQRYIGIQQQEIERAIEGHLRLDV